MQPGFIRLVRTLNLRYRFRQTLNDGLFCHSGDNTRIAIASFLNNCNTTLCNRGSPRFISRLYGLLHTSIPFGTRVSIHNTTKRLKHRLDRTFGHRLGGDRHCVSAFSGDNTRSIRVTIGRTRCHQRGTLRGRFSRLSFTLTGLATDSGTCIRLSHSRLSLPTKLLPSGLSCIAIHRIIRTIHRRGLTRLRIRPIFITLHNDFRNGLIGAIRLACNGRCHRPFTHFNLGIRFVSPRRPRRLRSLPTHRAQR